MQFINKKASNLLIPYPIQRNEDGSISFSTDQHILYTADFVDASYHFEDTSQKLPVFEFSFYPDREVDEVATDKRVGLTVIYILEIFFQHIDNVLLYVCESLDRRHFARSRKFTGWFRQYAGNHFEKLDYQFVTEGTEILVSVIFREDNTHKQEMIVAFEKAFGFYNSLK